jgi:hypothetical protein
VGEPGVLEPPDGVPGLLAVGEPGVCEAVPAVCAIVFASLVRPAFKLEETFAR